MSSFRKAIMLSVVTATFFCASILNAQVSPRSDNSSLDTQALNLDNCSFITKALAQITTKLAEDEGREAAEVSAMIKAEQDATEALVEIRKAKDKAKSEVGGKIREAERAESKFNQFQMSGDAEQTEKELVILTKAVKEKEQTGRTVELLEEAEQTGQQKRDQEKASRATAEQANRAKASRRTQQKAELKRLNDQWQINPTEKNLVALTDKITAIACEQDILANPFWKTTPTLGAIIFYQTIGQRSRGEDPNSINNPTQTQQPICLGKYYVWAERRGKATSDKNKTFTIYLGITEIIVVEDR